jgi:hypothetical protein
VRAEHPTASEHEGDLVPPPVRHHPSLCPVR